MLFYRQNLKSEAKQQIQSFTKLYFFFKQYFSLITILTVFIDKDSVRKMYISKINSPSKIYCFEKLLTFMKIKVNCRVQNLFFKFFFIDSRIIIDVILLCI